MMDKDDIPETVLVKAMSEFLHDTREEFGIPEGLQLLLEIADNGTVYYDWGYDKYESIVDDEE